MEFPSPPEFMALSWSQIQPYYEELESRSLNLDNWNEWLSDWSRLNALMEEMGARLRVATARDTTDTEVEAAYHAYLDDIYPNMQAADQNLKRKLLDSGLEPPGYETPLRKMRARADLFREENLLLQSEENRLGVQFNKVVGAQTVEWQGEEYTLTRLEPIYQRGNRMTRERIWRLVSERMLADREAINSLWGQFMDIRTRQAANAGFGSYGAYRWQWLHRFDYTPEDCRTFHRAIEEVVVPAASRIYEKHRQRFSVDTLRPWDLDLEQGLYPYYDPPLQPFKGASELKQVGARIFHRVNPELGTYFDIMQKEECLDLENRKGKAPGAFCASFEAIQRPFIFMNAVGTQSDVKTLLHESGHAFHNFETYALPFYHQRWSSMEFAEVASMAMELLAAPYLTRDQGGFYTPEQAARARVEHLEKIVLFWPYMAIVDAFQHWVYENPRSAVDPANCDAQWEQLWKRFIPGVNWEGLDDAHRTGWHRKRHIHRYPYYYIEYGLAQLGAIQVWRNARNNQDDAVAAYRRALSLGGTVSTPDLYETAGAQFAFNRFALLEAIELIEQVKQELEKSF